MKNMAMRKAAAGLAALAFVCLPALAQRGKHHRDYLDSYHQANSPARGMTALEGDWIYYDNNYLVEIDFDHDGDMEIKVRDSSQTETEWEGYWSATASQITFSVVKKEVKNYSNTARRKSTERVSETWTIDYSLSADGKLTLTCDSLPAEIASNTVYQRD